MKSTRLNLIASAPNGTRLQTSLHGQAWKAAVVALVALGACAGSALAADIPVTNGSFESPTVPPGFPAYPVVDSWQKAPQPAWFNPALTGGITWQQLSGVFPNPPVNDPERLENMQGNQAAYLFALPEVALFQDLVAMYQPGLSYHLTIGLFGAGGIADGNTLALSLYYRDGANQIVPVATTPVVYSAAGAPTTKRFTDYTVHLPEVQAGEAWAGQNIGLQFLATSGAGTGYWDLDNLRLVAVPEPATATLLALGLGGWLWRRRRAATARRDG